MFGNRTTAFDAGQWRATGRYLLAAWIAIAPVAAAALDLTAGSGAARECAGTAPTLHAASIAYLEPAPLSSIDEYGGGRYAPARANNVGVGVGFAELSAAAGRYCVGLLYREEMEGVATRDLIDILRGDHLSRPLDAGRDYQLHYDLRTLKAVGLRLRRNFDAGEVGPVRFTIALGASLLKPTMGRVQTLSGAVTASTPAYGVGTASWRRTDSDLDPDSFNPFVGAGHPSGIGFSTDLHLRAQTRSGGVFDLVAMDLLGEIHWRETRTSLRTFDNATIRYDENANRSAFVTGYDERVQSVQRIPTKWRMAFAQPVSPRVTVLLADDAVLGTHFVSFGARYGSGERFVAASVDVRTRALSFGARWGVVSASLTTDRLNWREAKTLGFSLDLAFRD